MASERRTMAARPRHRLRLFLGGVADALPGGFYGIYALEPAEFVGHLDADLDRAIQLVRGTDYAYNVAAATKRHPEDGRTDDGSYRRRDPGDAGKQWHVHLFEPSGSDEKPVEVYSHYEYAPLWPPDFARTREHYRPDWGSTYLQGRHCEVVKDLLADRGEYAGDPSDLGPAELAPY